MSRLLSSLVNVPWAWTSPSVERLDHLCDCFERQVITVNFERSQGTTRRGRQRWIGVRSWGPKRLRGRIKGWITSMNSKLVKNRTISEGRDEQCQGRVWVVAWTQILSYGGFECFSNPREIVLDKEQRWVGEFRLLRFILVATKVSLSIIKRDHHDPLKAIWNVISVWWQVIQGPVRPVEVFATWG